MDLFLVGGDEREKFCDRPDVIVGLAGMDGFAVPAVRLPGQPVDRVGGPATERGGLPGGSLGIAENVVGVLEGGGEPIVEALKALKTFLAHRRPTQRPGFQLGAQVPLDCLSQPPLGELPRCASVVRLRLPRRQRDPRVAARMPVIKSPPLGDTFECDKPVGAESVQ